MADLFIPREVATGVPMGEALTRFLMQIANGKTGSSIGSILSGLDGKYGLAVDGSDNATIEALDGSGDYGSAVNISASVISLAAPAINFGPDMTFEATYNTFVIEDGSGTRTRIGAPFPASGDLSYWYGLDSVALNSETKENAIWAESIGAEDVYKDGVPLGNTSGFTASVSPSSVSGSGAGTATTGSAAVSASGGSTPYAYLWTCQNSAGVVTNAYPDTPTADTTTVTSTTSETGVLRCIISDADSIVRVVTATYALTVT